MSESENHLDGFVPSPCIGVCTLEGDYCAGCYRTTKEIAEWPGLSNEEKRDLMLVLAKRQALDQRGELHSSAEEPGDEWD